jgi:hypothetical protein
LEENLIAELKKFFATAAAPKNLAEELKEINRLELKNDLSKQQLFNVLVVALFDEDFSPTRLIAREQLLKQVTKTSLFKKNYTHCRLTFTIT